MLKYSMSEDTRMIFLGIDNGPSGSIGIQEFNKKGMRLQTIFLRTPTIMMQDYTKAKKRISQLDFSVLRPMFRQWGQNSVEVVSAMERPLVNPGRFIATAVGLRVHQQWLDLFAFYKEPFPVSLDSREWQKLLLPKGTTGEELKKRSREIGERLFPCCKDVKHPDCDGMMISEWLRRSRMMK